VLDCAQIVTLREWIYLAPVALAWKIWRTVAVK
jgi:hypothetical protein